MGTNYYFMTNNKDLVQNCFANKHSWGVADEEYTIVDEPFLGYSIHLNKLSYGWRPLFQRHKPFESWKELERFYFDHSDDLWIYDEYGELFTWEKYAEKIFRHADAERRPMKWDYGIDPIDKCFSDYPKKRVHLRECKEGEKPDIWTPFDHVIYSKTEKAAFDRWGHMPWIDFETHHWNDPEYPIDWTEGEFC